MSLFSWKQRETEITRTNIDVVIIATIRNVKSEPPSQLSSYDPSKPYIIDLPGPLPGPKHQTNSYAYMSNPFHWRQCGGKDLKKAYSFEKNKELNQR